MRAVGLTFIRDDGESGAGQESQVGFSPTLSSFHFGLLNEVATPSVAEAPCRPSRGDLHLA